MTSLGDLKDEFYTFGIYGRDFNLDVYVDESAAGALQMSSVLIALAALAALIGGI